MPKDPVPVVADDEDEQYTTKDTKTTKSGKEGKTSNPNQNVGGTAKDGGLSTADTVADGGEDEADDDPSYKPS